MKYTLFKKKLLLASLTPEDFSNISNIPISTINGWGTTRQNKKTPAWVESFLDIYIENKNNKIIIEDLKRDIRNYGKN
ncbi:MAG: XRE family transcriptional regulator [Sulfurospirillum sp.]|nr:XRE family transcriptional regulator [Sulfurospirillum sp.]